jgi:hypothetical protein
VSNIVRGMEKLIDENKKSTAYCPGFNRFIDWVVA